MVRARFRVNGAGVCLQLPRGDFVTVCGCWSGRDSGERTQQEALADRTGASSRGRSVGRMAAGCRRRRQAGSGRARNRARARSNWASQGQRCGRCRVRRRAERGDPSGQGEEPPPEGLGGHHLLAQTDARRPAGDVVGHHLYRQPGGVGGEAARGEMVQPDAVLEVSDGILDLGVAAMVEPPVRATPRPGR